MAVLNRPGVLMYHVALLILFGTLFLTLKNINVDDFTETPQLSEALKTWIFAFVGIIIAFGFVLTIASLLSKARKKSVIVNIMLILYWLNIGIISFTAYLTDVLKDDIVSDGSRWMIISLGTIFFFILSLIILLFKFPGKVEENLLAEKVRKKLAARESKTQKPYCPECKTDVESSFKYCPGCGAKFSD